ncbi:MAG: VWA domain-containing protein [Planctomycetaceae bacterium]
MLAQTTVASAAPLSGTLYHPQAADVEQTFAIGLKSDTAGQLVNRDLVVLVDTSASQMGDHRALALNVLENLLGSLSEQDRVRLVAVDVSVEDLTTQFATINSEEVRTGLATLKSRVPLGVTNLMPAMEHALSLLENSEQGAICYIGDGMSRGRLISVDQMGGLINNLQERKIAVHSFGVGPMIDFQVLGTLANFTGGVIKFDNEEMTAEKGAAVGKELAQALKMTVEYPAGLTCESAELLPGEALPLRGDRETIYLAHGTLPAEMKLEDGAEVKLVTNEKIENILDTAWQTAQVSGGLKVAFAGSELLELQEKAILTQLDQLGEQGERALDLKDHRSANRISQQMAQLNPGNRHAELLNSDSRKFKLLNVSQQDSLLDPAPPAEEELLPREGGEAENLLEAERQLIRINEQHYALEVERLIEESNDKIFLDPESVISEIKRAITHVAAVNNIGPDVRDELIRKLKSKLAEAQNRIEIAEQLRIQVENERSQLEARERAVDQLLRDEEQLEAWMERVRALLADAVRGNDDAFEEAQAVASKALQARPRQGTATAARIQSEALTQLNLVYDLNELRRDRWLAALEEVEKSHVPFPDEPPIAYPAPEIWQALTRNREKWKQVSIFKQTPREQKIREELDRVYELDVEGLSLEEALQQIEDQGGFMIQVHSSVTDTADLGSIEIENSYSGIKLRSILRLLLGPSELTYAIKDEVLFIISEEEAQNNTDFLQLKIYPVTDLVIPIQNISGGQGINGTQNGGNGQNSFGNNGNNNGNFFSVPDTIQPERFDLKKKALNR